MSATLTMKRESVIMELRRAPFEITLDDKTVGSIDRHGSFETQVAPGHHTLQVRAGRYTSPAHGFDVADGDAVNFRCSGARIWPIYLVSFAVSSLGLSLKPDDGRAA